MGRGLYNELNPNTLSIDLNFKKIFLSKSYMKQGENEGSVWNVAFEKVGWNDHQKSRDSGHTLALPKTAKVLLSAFHLAVESPYCFIVIFHFSFINCQV